MCKFIGYGLKESGANLNVVNILRTLVEDEECEVFAPYNYDKESKKPHDPNISFIPNATAKVVNLTSSRERFNVNITAVLPVMVNGEMKKVYRNYSVIRDNELNIKSLWSRVNDYYDVLKNGGIIKNETPDGLVELDFTKIPLISPNWAQPNQCRLYDMMEEDINLSADLREIRKVIKDFRSKLYIEESQKDSEIYVESVSNSDNEEEHVSKTVDCVIYDLPEYKPVTNTEISYPNLEAAEIAKKKLSKRQADIRFAIRMIVWSIEQSAKKGSYEWSEMVKVPRSKDKYYQITEVSDSRGNVLKLRRLRYMKEI